jgi:hypothetical protein
VRRPEVDALEQHDEQHGAADLFVGVFDPRLRAD